MSKLAHSHQPTMDEIEARRIEDEANEFAMCLLMPADLVRAEIRKLGGIDMNDEAKIAKLAAKFRVAITMMTLRIGQLSR